MTYLFLILGGLLGIIATLGGTFLLYVRQYRQMLTKYGESTTLRQAIRYMALGHD